MDRGGNRCAYPDILHKFFSIFIRIEADDVIPRIVVPIQFQFKYCILDWFVFKYVVVDVIVSIGGCVMVIWFWSPNFWGYFDEEKLSVCSRVIEDRCSILRCGLSLVDQQWIRFTRLS